VAAECHARWKALFGASLFVCLILTGVVTIRAQQTAAVQMAQPDADISAGKKLVLEVRLDKPLPLDSSVIARVRPEGAAQLVQLSSAIPDDASRTKFTLNTTLPTPVVPGKWTLEAVFVTLPGSGSWQSIEHNQLTFQVQGKPFPIPSKAEVTVTH
jgi:hypothetical protein